VHDLDSKYNGREKESPASARIINNELWNWKTRVDNSCVIPKLSFKERWWSAIREQQQFLRYLCKISAIYCKSHETIIIRGLVLPTSYLSTNIRDQFLTELVTKVKSNIYSVEVQLQLSNNGHSALMGGGSFWLHPQTLAICINIFWTFPSQKSNYCVNRWESHSMALSPRSMLSKCSYSSRRKQPRSMLSKCSCSSRRKQM